jgi:hypothetical protein
VAVESDVVLSVVDVSSLAESVFVPLSAFPVSLDPPVSVPVPLSVAVPLSCVVVPVSVTAVSEPPDPESVGVSPPPLSLEPPQPAANARDMNETKTARRNVNGERIGVS